MNVNYWYRIRLVGIMYCVTPAYVNTQGEIGSQTRVSIVPMFLTSAMWNYIDLTVVCPFHQLFGKNAVCIIWGTDQYKAFAKHNSPS